MEEIRRQRQLLKEQENALKAKEKIVSKNLKIVDKINAMFEANPVGTIIWEYKRQYQMKTIKEQLNEQIYEYTREYDKLDENLKFVGKTFDPFTSEKFLEFFKDWICVNLPIQFSYAKTTSCSNGGEIIKVDYETLKELIIIFDLGTLVPSEEKLLEAWRKEVGIVSRNCNICYEDKYCINGFYRVKNTNQPISITNCERSCECKVDVCIDCVKQLQNKCPTCRSKFVAWGK